MKIALITSGAAGMFCGSCLRDNSLVSAFRKLGHDALLIPTYTPIRTDESDMSESRVYFGGINVYLEQKTWLFRHTPWLVDRLLNFNWLLRWASRFAVRTEYSKLGKLTVSMLQGRGGKQRKEVARLISHLADDVRPDVVLLSNALLSGIVPELKKSLRVPIWLTLQGDDIFLEALPEADRRACLELIRTNDAAAQGYICTSRYYADFMAGYLGIAREKMHIVHPGINLAGHGGERTTRREPPFTIGYFARICPEKGFHHFIDAFLQLREGLGKEPALQGGSLPVRLRASGWLGENNREFFESQCKKLEAAGLRGDFEYVDSPSHDDKVKFLQSVDLLSVPTTYHEPKGLYILEAWANGIPVVQPRHGSFPELIEAASGGALVPPGDPVALASAWQQLLTDPELRDRLGRSGAATVRERFTAEIMARNTLQLLEQTTT